MQTATSTTSITSRRVILHVDMDAFFVSVELLRRPELAGRPVVVGGTGRRGVVAAASYEARRFGIHSAMPSAHARRLCPAAVFLAGDHAEYSRVSREVHAVLETFTPLIEPISLDEAFLDVTGATALFGDGSAIGHRIRAAIGDRLGLACSVGVAANKFLAKMASVEAKPRPSADGIAPGHGVFEVVAGGETAFLHPLPVRRLWGVGPATAERLAGLGVRTIGDLAATAAPVLQAVLGTSAAERLRELAAGIDDRPVEVDRPVKSISHEETYPDDLFDPAAIDAQLGRLADGVASRLRERGYGARTITVKVRDSAFRTRTRSRTLPTAVASTGTIRTVARELFAPLRPAGGVRLLGVAASKFGDTCEQLTLDGLGLAPTSAADDAPGGRRPDSSGAIDRVRDRFGPDAIAAASALTAQGGAQHRVKTIDRRRNPWGPDTNEQADPH